MIILFLSFNRSTLIALLAQHLLTSLMGTYAGLYMILFDTLYYRLVFV